MNKWVAFFFGTALMTWSVLAANPKDMTISGYKKFKMETEKTIAKTLTKDYSADEDKIKLLEKPFRIGDEISITMEQGSRTRIVQGVFKGIRGNQAEIAGRKYLLRDIVEIDRQRLFYGVNSQMLQIQLNQMRKKLEEEKQTRAKSLREIKYKQAGYTPAFFRKVIEIGDRYWLKSELGDNTISATVEVSDKDDYVNFTISNDSGESTDAIFLLDGKPVASSDTFKRRRGVWKRGSFQVRKSDLGNAPFAAASKLSLWQYKDDVADWRLKLGKHRRPSTRSKTLHTCPECDGSKESIKVSKAEDGKETTEKIPCPTCAETGMLDSDPYEVKKAKYKFMLRKTSISNYSRRSAAKFNRTFDMSGEYAAVIQASKAEARTAVRKAREEKEAAAAAEALAKEEAAARRKAEMARIAGIEGTYIWLTPEDAKAVEPPISANETVTIGEYDDIGFPTLWNDKAVERFTNWTKISSRDRSIFGRKYRFLKVVEEEKLPVYLLQYQFQVMKNVGEKFHADITIQFKDKSEDKFTDIFEVPAAWRGRMFIGVRPVTLDRMEIQVSNVGMQQTPGTATEEQPVTTRTDFPMLPKKGKDKSKEKPAAPAGLPF